MKGWTLALMGIFLANVQAGLALLNLSLKRTTTSTPYLRSFGIEYGPSNLVVDGNDSDQLKYNATTAQCLYTIDRLPEAFWQVDLAQDVILDHVEIIFRRGLNKREHKRRRNGYSIIVSETPTYLPRTRDNTCYRDTDLSSRFRDNRSCSNIGRYVTIYNERTNLRPPRYSNFAILELCEVKVMGCPINKHGVHCRENCPTNCIDFLCFPGNGTCMRGCQPGYQGDTCQDECDDYFYGNGCADECFCKKGPCTKVFGFCPPGGCEPGYRDRNCSIECGRGTFGVNCAKNCGFCKSGRHSCNHVGGTCTNGCLPGYKVDQCIQVCDAGMYGENCRETCGSCFQGTPCHHVNATCLTGCDPGKKGDNCKTNCSRGEYGPNCENTCGMCKQGTDSCIITDGTCPGGCMLGWQGPLCERVCDSGRYGEKCRETCGSCFQGTGCHHVNGTCLTGCDPGKRGDNCKTDCPINTHGMDCTDTCPSNCINNLCFPQNGTCMKGCLRGYHGHTCQDECADYSYGYGCAHECFCKGRPCDKASGVCPSAGCEPGYRGTTCNTDHTLIGTIIDVITGALLVAVMIVGVVAFMVIKKRRRRVPVTNREMGVQYDNMAAGMHADTEQSHMYEKLGNTDRAEETQNEANSYEIVL